MCFAVIAGDVKLNACSPGCITPHRGSLGTHPENFLDMDQLASAIILLRHF